MKCPNCDVEMELFVQFREKNGGRMYKYYCEVCGSIYVVDEDGDIVRKEQ